VSDLGEEEPGLAVVWADHRRIGNDKQDMLGHNLFLECSGMRLGFGQFRAPNQDKVIRSR
jgi:hypothetical protein